MLQYYYIKKLKHFFGMVFDIESVHVQKFILYEVLLWNGIRKL